MFKRHEAIKPIPISIIRTPKPMNQKPMLPGPYSGHCRTKTIQHRVRVDRIETVMLPICYFKGISTVLGCCDSSVHGMFKHRLQRHGIHNVVVTKNCDLSKIQKAESDSALSKSG